MRHLSNSGNSSQAGRKQLVNGILILAAGSRRYDQLKWLPPGGWISPQTLRQVTNFVLRQASEHSRRGAAGSRGQLWWW